MGEDLHVDPGLVHFLQAQFAEVIEPLEHVRIAHAFGAGELRRQLLVPVVLLQRDHRTLRPLQHDAYSPRSLVWTSFLAIATKTVTNATVTNATVTNATVTNVRRCRSGSSVSRRSDASAGTKARGPLLGLSMGLRTGGINPA
jgi:hypothetical protein